MKSQALRLVDVFVLGPGMIYYAVKWKGPPDLARAALAFTGLMVILYNGSNYLEMQRRLNAAP